MNRLFFVMGMVFLALLELAAGRHSRDSKSRDGSEAECGSSEDCGLARPLCHEGQCIGTSCDAHGLDGLWDDDWDGRPPMVGNFSISYFRYLSKLGCLCMFNDWVSSLQRICDDNYGFFQLTLRHGVGGWEDGVLENWEFYLFGDASSIIVRDGFIVQQRKKVSHLVGVGFSGSPNMEKSHTTYELCFPVERGASVKVSLADAVSGEPNASACVSSLPQQEPLEMVVAIPTDESHDHRVSAIPLPGGIAPATVISGTLSLTMRVGSAGLAPFTGLAPSPWAWLCLQWGLAVTLKLPPWLVAVNNVSNNSLDTLIVKYGITYPSAASGVVPLPLSSDDIQDRAKSCVKDTSNMLLRYGQASWGTSLLSCTLDHPTKSHQCVTSSQCPTTSRPLCQNGVCVEMSCAVSDSGVLIDGMWEDAWEGLVPSTGEHSLVYALFYPASSCVCLFNDWLDNFGRTCADNSHLYNFTLTRGNGWVLRSGETWELQLFGDGEVAVSRDGLTIRSRGPGGDLAVSTFDSSPNLKERHTTAEVCFPGEAGSTYEISIADPVSASSFTGQCIDDGPQKEPAAISLRLPTNGSTLHMVGKPRSALVEGLGKGRFFKGSFSFAVSGSLAEFMENNNTRLSLQHALSSALAVGVWMVQIVEVLNVSGSVHVNYTITQPEASSFISVSSITHVADVLQPRLNVKFEYFGLRGHVVHSLRLTTPIMEYTCTGSHDCSLTTPLCRNSVCVALRCEGARYFDGRWDAQWASVPPRIATYSVNYFMFLDESKCLCLFSDWISSTYELGEADHAYLKFIVEGPSP